MSRVVIGRPVVMLAPWYDCRHPGHHNFRARSVVAVGCWLLAVGTLLAHCWTVATKSVASKPVIVTSERMGLRSDAFGATPVSSCPRCASQTAPTRGDVRLSIVRDVERNVADELRKYMHYDAAASKAMSVFPSSRRTQVTTALGHGETKGSDYSLFAILNKTSTAMGARRLKGYVAECSHSTHSIPRA